jgi:hypothetical protein
MLMIIAFLVVYFALLTRMKQVVELNRKYHKALQMPVSQNSNIVEEEIIDQLFDDYKMHYIHLFERV